MAAIGTRIDRIFKKAAEEAAKIGVSIKSPLPEDKIFSFEDYPETHKQIERLMKALQDSTETTIVNGVRSAWTLSNNKNNDLVSRIFGDKAKELSKEEYKRYFSTNMDALNAFLLRKEQGLNLSDRVWRYTNAFKKEIELGLDLGIRTGESAAQMTRSLRQYLQHPDKLFRRVRDQHGNLKLSKAAAAFHPGRGVYRSSCKNARRLACTETNIAYRTSDHLRWQQMDFVVGIEIKLSNNHTLNGVPLTDICDTLAGKYPKDFKFTGWHPHCRCHAITILKTEEEMQEDTKRILAGENPKKGSVNAIGDVPDAFKAWIEGNKERAKGWFSMPQFIRQNPQHVNGFEVDTYTKAERKFTRSRKTNEAMQESLGIFLQRKYPEIPNTEKAAIYYYTQGEGAAFRQLNNQLRKGNLSEFNEAFSQLLSQGLSKLKTTTETVYRKVRLNKTNLGEYLSLAEKKETAVFKGFTSTSLDRQTAIDFRSNSKPKKNETDVLLVIRGKSGHPIEDLSQFGGRFARKTNQREVLFDSGCEFSFDKIKIEDGRYVFYLTEI